MISLNQEDIHILKEQETLLATVSHDLKNPIVSVLLAVRLLNNSQLNPYQKEILTNVDSTIRYMKSLVENILDRYRFNNQVCELQKVSLNFTDFVISVLNKYQYIYRDKDQIVKLSVDLDKCFVELDNLEIERVINNLLLNASKYSPQKSEIKISLFKKEDNVCFSIENPISSKVDTDNMFDKFVTSKNNSMTMATGLGLYIVKQVIALHNGEIFADSENDKYMRITFVLPLK